MNFTLKILEIKTINEIEGYWNNNDYIHLLEELEFEDVKKIDPKELRELVEMSISDFEPHEAAEFLLKYKLKDKLSKGQIQNISHEMSAENETDQNSNMALHYTLFNINQLLRKSYNGKFPNSKATKIILELSFPDDLEIEVNNELVLKSICKGLSENSPLVRLFEKQLNGQEAFNDLAQVIWDMNSLGKNEYSIITSDYWINDEDINEYEFSGSIKLFEVKAKNRE